MKKAITIIAVVLLVAGVLALLTACGVVEDVKNSKLGRGVSNALGKSEITYQASTRFLYSTDGGTSWSETIQEIPVNTTYYLAVEMQVSQSENTKEEQTVVATITIPSTTVLDCYLDDHPGVSITGKTDAVTNDVSYDFNVVAGTSPIKFRVVFECKPLTEGRAKVEVVYDDLVSPNWDSTGTIKYVAAQTEEETD